MSFYVMALPSKLTYLLETSIFEVISLLNHLTTHLLTYKFKR